MEIMHKGMWTGRRVLYLSVDAIRANPDQPRKYFEPEALRELAESIGRYGILQPLTVRRRENGYELIAGERRLRAAGMAGLTQALSLNPRPGYQHDPTRRYGFSFDGLDVRFTIDGDTLTVVEVVTL